MVVLSKSSLNTYITCPKLYKFLYVDKIKIDIKSPAAQRGIDVHNFAEAYYDHLTISGSNLYIDQSWLDEQFYIATDEAKPYYVNFLDFEEKRWKLCVEHYPENPGKYYMPIMKEKKILNLGLEMVGIIDRVDLNFDGKTYTITDYKTEAYSEKSWKRTEHRREMAFYKKLLETSGEIEGEVTHFCIYYPRSNDVWVERFNNRTINALERQLEKVRQKIGAEEFPCNVSYFCKYCDCNMMCPFE
jgi:hypothetical protein